MAMASTSLFRSTSNSSSKSTASTSATEAAEEQQQPPQETQQAQEQAQAQQEQQHGHEQEQSPRPQRAKPKLQRRHSAPDAKALMVAQHRLRARGKRWQKLTFLAHVGSYVPAESAVIGLTDRIFSRMHCA